MTQYLPPNLLALFAPRDPIPFLPPNEKLPHEKNGRPYIGLAAFLGEFENPEDTPAPTRAETKEEKKDRKKREREEQIAYKLEQDLALWSPHENPLGTEDAFKTLFVSRINFDTSESKLRREFESYGPITMIRMVHDVKTSKPRGYAFIEYQQERDMHAAYKHSDGKKIDSRRVLVDVERSRTVKNWRPRRLGGGLGNTRKGPAEENSRMTARDEEMGGGAGAAGRGRSRSKSRDRRRRGLSRDRDRRRSPVRERRRSRDRDDGGERKRSRSRDRRRRRSRSKDRARRSRSRDRKRPRRSRSRDRDRKKDRKRDEDGVYVKEENKEQDGRYGQPGVPYPDDEEAGGPPVPAVGGDSSESLLQPAYMKAAAAAGPPPPPPPPPEESNGAEQEQ